MDRARDYKTGSPWIGRDARRVEDATLLRGAGRFIDDLALPDCLHLQFLRSANPHGRIVALDVSAARAAPGVVLVLTGADLTDLGELSVNALIDDLHLPRSPILPAKEITAVGQPLVAVVASSIAAALDAIQLIEIEIEELPLWGKERDVFVKRFTGGDVGAAFSSAAMTVGVAVQHARLAPAALEPRCAMVAVDKDENLRAWIATQAPHRARTEIANLLGLREEKVSVVAPDIGGAFGGKASLHPEDIVVAAAASRLGKPVKWFGSRSEEFLSASQGRGAVGKGELALDKEGRFIGLRAEFDFPLGAWLPFSAVVPARNAGRILPGPYDVQNVDVTIRGRRQNTAAVGIYRGAGRPEAAMLMERLVEAAARAFRVDPIELRRRNVIAPERFPHTSATGEKIDSGNFPKLLSAASDRASYGRLILGRGRRRARGEVCGIGSALYLEPAGQGWESAAVSLASDGCIIAATGTSAQGQGRETTFAQIVGDAIGIDPTRVRVVHGDTQKCPAGVGALASRSTAIGGSAVFEAAEKFREAARRCAALIMHQPSDQVALTPHGFEVFGTVHHLAWEELAAQIHSPGRLPSSFEAGLKTTAVYHAEGEAWSSGCCIAAVAVEIETGELRVEKLTWIDDAGVIVNPMLARGQCLGGMAQGIGEGLLERLVYDADGQLITASLMDYALPRARDIPAIDLDHIETASPFNLLGAKGVGEAGCIGIPAAIVNAALDALAPFGVTHLDMPLTSEKIWKSLHEKRTIAK